MDKRLQELYDIPENVLPQDLYLQDLVEQCGILEAQMQELLQLLPDPYQQQLQAYIAVRDELEF